MNYNIQAYIIYLCISTFITIWVGRNLHQNGYYLILNLFDNEAFTKTINNLLLVGYYLVNLGYVAITVVQFKTIQSIPHLLETLGYRVGIVLLILSLLHYNNIFILTQLSKRKQQLTQFFNP